MLSQVNSVIDAKKKINYILSLYNMTKFKHKS